MFNEPSISEAYKNLSRNADLLYNFVIKYSNYIYANHNYTPEYSFNMIEIHTLTYIDDNPGVTITELARYWEKTKSALSQIVKKLCSQGLVEKKHTENNRKNAPLYVTPEGHRLSYIHKAFDVADITETTCTLAGKCGEEDIAAFYRVLEEYFKLLKDENF